MNEPEMIIDELGRHLVTTHCNIIPFTDIRMFGIKFRLPKDIFSWTEKQKALWIEKQCESFKKEVTITISSLAKENFLDPNSKSSLCEHIAAQENDIANLENEIVNLETSIKKIREALKKVFYS